MRTLLLFLFAIPALCFGQDSAVKFRWGLRAGVNLPLISGLDPGSNNKVGAMGGISTEIKFLNTPRSILVDLYVNQMNATSPNGSQGIEVVYISLPIAYGHAFSNRLMTIVGIEPSFVAESKYYDPESYYDASVLSKGTVFGITAGARYFIVPKSWYLDLRAIGGLSPMFDIHSNKPHKLNLSIGYYFKY